ncbi:hypothetical protein MUK42_37512 [Musa troglodytarum]|uniref:Uncharacterized protein n=1 Tax=Musa troglodytarum TaxID=320322 RepID=A0A9E7GGI3_9LILI|nr:hypothetical protein MUK42_37512 [Musa troglodytarum]
MPPPFLPGVGSSGFLVPERPGFGVFPFRRHRNWSGSRCDADERTTTGDRRRRGIPFAFCIDHLSGAGWHDQKHRE